MKVFKRLAAVISAVVIAVSATASMAVTAGADSIADTAKAISSGTTYKCEFIENWEYSDYKINVSSSGTLSVKLDSTLEYAELELFDSDFNYVYISDYSITSGNKRSGGSGSWYIDLRWNDVGEKLAITTIWKVTKGTYYLRLHNNYGNGINHCWSSGKANITATYPSTTSKAKFNYLTLNLSRGYAISLGADTTGSAEVTWKSSKPSVATVSSTGKVTAKSTGTTIISAKCGKTTKKIKIIVT